MNMTIRREADREEYIDTLLDRIDELEEENRKKENEIEELYSENEELKNRIDEVGISLNNVINNIWGDLDD